MVITFCFFQVLDRNSQDKQHVNKFVSIVLHCFAGLF
jgi:hypothetical protein